MKEMKMSENVLVVTFEVTVKEEYAWDSMGRAKAEFAVPKGFLHAIDPGNILEELVKSAERDFVYKKAKKKMDEDNK